MKVLTIFGTRPEAIKFAPLIKELKTDNFFEVKVCLSGQHKEMLDQVLDFFEIEADYNLKLMKPNQTLFDITTDFLLRIEPVLDEFKPDVVFVQGDTTTSFVGGLAAFYKKIKVAHLEAGLRSGNIYSPFPEEGNRKLLSPISNYHFPPTPLAAEALERENIKENVFMVGNTVIDALYLGLNKLKEQDVDYFDEFPVYKKTGKIILLTAHRRESFGEPLRNICRAILEVTQKFQDVQIIFPVHYNPNVRNIVYDMLKGHPQITLIDPVDYSKLIWLIANSDIIVTDSGGIQEEAPSLGKPVLVLREVTERIEGVISGTAKLVGTDRKKIYDEISGLLVNKNDIYTKMSKAINPYGDGTTSKKIVTILKSISLEN